MDRQEKLFPLLLSGVLNARNPGSPPGLCEVQPGCRRAQRFGIQLPFRHLERRSVPGTQSGQAIQRGLKNPEKGAEMELNQRPEQ